MSTNSSDRFNLSRRGGLRQLLQPQTRRKWLNSSTAAAWVAATAAVGATIIAVIALCLSNKQFEKNVAIQDSTLHMQREQMMQNNIQDSINRENNKQQFASTIKVWQNQAAAARVQAAASESQADILSQSFMVEQMINRPSISYKITVDKNKHKNKNIDLINNVYIFSKIPISNMADTLIVLDTNYSPLLAKIVPNFSPSLIDSIDLQYVLCPDCTRKDIPPLYIVNLVGFEMPNRKRRILDKRVVIWKGMKDYVWPANTHQLVDVSSNKVLMKIRHMLKNKVSVYYEY